MLPTDCQAASLAAAGWPPSGKAVQPLQWLLQPINGTRRALLEARPLPPAELQLPGAAMWPSRARMCMSRSSAEV